jgi:Predicted glycosyl hydrolase
VKLKPMSYKSYVWPMNPETLRVEYARNLREVRLPFSGSILQDLGSGARVVTGSGRFTGSGCLEEFARLEALFAQDGSGALQLPGAQSFSAAFASLKMTGEARPDSVAYEFVFLEDGGSDAVTGGSVSGGVYVCAGGETLWAVANRYGTTVDRLRALNPMIQWPNALQAGLKVVLP